MNSIQLYFLHQNSTCQPCPNYCQNCHNQDTCNQCIDGYILDNQKCLKNCPKGKYLNQTSCSDCSEGCLECLTKDICIKCAESLFLTDNNKCIEVGGLNELILLVSVICVPLFILFFSPITLAIYQFIMCISAPFRYLLAQFNINL